MALKPIGYRVDGDILVRRSDTSPTIVELYAEDTESEVDVNIESIADLIEALEQVVSDAEEVQS